jgi:O-antigen/teichoic acid export membrane protein
VADQVVASATNFLTGVIIGRTCTQAEFGLYMLALSIVLVTLRLQRALISTPFVVLSPRLGPGDRATYTGSTLVHLGMAAAIGMAGLAVAALGLGQRAGGDGLASGLTPVLWVVAFALPAILLREYARNVWFAELRFGATLVLDTVAGILQVGVIAALAWSGRLSATTALVAVGSVCVVVGAAWLTCHRRSVAFDVARIVSDLKVNWSYGRWMFASGTVWELSSAAYPWLIAMFHGAAATGVWAACFGTVSAANPLALGIQNISGPKIAHAYAADGPRALRRSALVWMAVAVAVLMPIVALLVTCGDWFVTLLYEDQYAGNGVIVALLALELLIAAPRFTASWSLFVIDRGALDTASNVIAIVVLGVAGWWLTRQLGPAGAALGILVSGLAVTIVKVMALDRITRRATGRW